MKTRIAFLLALAVGARGAAPNELETARDRQDRPALEKMIADLSAAAAKQASDAPAQYRLALAQSYLAEVAIELKDKGQAKTVAEAGIKTAERAVALKPQEAEYHRLLGTLCGQVIPANALLGMKYGRCALDSINKAIELDPKSAPAYLSRGVGNYYLPPAFGGGPELAVKDFEKALELNPKSAEAKMWLGIALRKLNRNADARTALAKSLEMNPNRMWAKQQLEKTPAN
ncbi:MAG: tetratricopeptide repeat protein [Bryobacteraceae bacterium]